jgi:hypothetical protein
LTIGCATLFKSKKSSISLSSTPSGAEVFVDGSRVGQTPVILELPNKKEHTVVFRKDGYGETTCRIDNSVGAGWVILDVLGGLIPVIIDAATGAWYNLDPKACNVNLTAA